MDGPNNRKPLQEGPFLQGRNSSKLKLKQNIYYDKMLIYFRLDKIKLIYL